MDIKFTLQDIDGNEYTEDQLELLMTSLDLTDCSELESHLVKIAEASLIEYLEMLIGKGMSNRADESKQDRLFYLIKKFYSPYLPSDDEVSTVFQLTSTQSRTLLRNTLSRYRTRLSNELQKTLTSTFRSAQSTNSGYDLTIASDVFVEQFNLIVAKEGAGYNPVKKKSVGSKLYFMSTDTYNALENHIGG